MEAIARLKAGQFNYMSQEQKPDGSVLVTLLSREYLEPVQFRVWDLYGPEEKVLAEKEIPKETPAEKKAKKEVSDA